MSLSQKDTNFLILIIILALILVFYFVPYKMIHKEKLALTNEIMNLETTYNQISMDVVKESEYLEGIETTKKQIIDLDNMLPYDLPQEMLIYKIDDIEKTIGIKMPSITIGQKEILFSLNQANTDQTSISTDQNNEGVNNQGQVDASQETAIKTTVTTSTSLTYQQLKELLAYLYEGDINQVGKQRIVLNGLQLTNDVKNGILNASFNLSFYALVSDDREVVPLDLGNYDMKKQNVFDPFDGTGIQVDTQEVTENTLQDSKADFFIMLDPITADNSTLIVGQSDDSDRNTYSYSDDDGVVDMELEFYQSSGKYYCRYKTGTDQYPDNYSLGVEFEVGKAIEVQVYSSDRNSDLDVSGADATIINNTDLPVNIVYSSEDSINPRLNIISTEGEVIIH